MHRAASTGSCKSILHSPPESFSSILFQFLGIIDDALVQQTHYFGVLAAVTTRWLSSRLMLSYT